MRAFYSGITRNGSAVTPLTKCPLRRANPWVQDLCKHPSVVPYLAPPKKKIHKMAPWEQP